VSAASPLDRDTLRTIQKPLKDRYRADGATALVTLSATGVLGSETVSCSVQTGRALVEAGLHPATGGPDDGSLACSGDMLLEALAACAGVTLRSVATARGLSVGGTVRVEGDLDFRGTLGLDRDVPVGFRSIRLHFDLTTDASDDDVSALLETTERYCVVLQTITGGTPVSLGCSRS
jgi:uncharacterized OsmC-like protein